MFAIVDKLHCILQFFFYNIIFEVIQQQNLLIIRKIHDENYIVDVWHHWYNKAYQNAVTIVYFCAVYVCIHVNIYASFNHTSGL